MWGYKQYPSEKIHFRPVWGNIFLKSNSSIYYSISKGGREGFVCLDLTSEKAMATHSSTLAWKIPWTEKPGRLQSMGLRRVEHDWATSFSLLLSCIGEENGNHSSVLAWRIPGMGGAWWAAVYGVAHSRTRLKRLSSSSSSSSSSSRSYSLTG